MRVNILLDVGSGSGINAAALRFKEELKERGIKVSLNDKGYDYDIFHFQRPTPLHFFKLLKAKKKGLKIVVHAHTTIEDMKGSFILTQNKKLMSSLGKYISFFYNKADIVLTPSSWSKSTLIKRGVTKPIEVLSNGVDLKKFKFCLKKRSKFREKYSVSDKDIVVYNVGYLFFRKGLETFRKVAEKLTELKFCWVGKGFPLILMNNMRKIYKVTHDLPPNLRFLGYVDDLVSVHCGGDILLFPSFAENQGVAILEAAACSRAMVVRDLPTYDWAIHKKNCFIAKNDKEFLEGVEYISKNKKLRDRIGKEVRKFAKKNDINKTIEKLVEIYENLLAS